MYVPIIYYYCIYDYDTKYYLSYSVNTYCTSVVLMVNRKFQADRRIIPSATRFLVNYSHFRSQITHVTTQCDEKTIHQKDIKEFLSLFVGESEKVEQQCEGILKDGQNSQLVACARCLG